MAVTSGVGPPVVLDGPLPLAPEHCLLSVPGVLVTEDDNHWMNGGVVYPYPPDEPVNWDPCSVGTYRTKVEGDAIVLPYFSSFVAYLPITCSSGYVGDPDMFRDRASLALDAVISFAVEQALSQGVDQSGNPFFTDGNMTTPAGTSALSPKIGLRWLEETIGATGRQGLIHATPAVVAAWDFLDLREDPREMDVLESTVGTQVASGGGYIGAQKLSERLLGHAVPSGKSWAFATGPVQVRVSETIVTDVSESLDRSDNNLTFRAERYVLATWDAEVQAGVLIDWTI